MRWEIILGRGIACCLHPHVAWRRYSPRWRAVMIVAYAGGGFAATMAALLLT
jgi:hypothetical protein